jgi:hypothetical protein
MSQELLDSLRHLSDDELVGRLEELAARERGQVAQLIAHLAELDTRDAHFRAGHASLFAYCRDALGLPEHEAYNRIEVARAARRFPAILEMLTQGTLSPTAVRLLAPHLTPENHRSVLESARGKRKPEVEEIVARLSPRPDAASFVRRLPASSAPVHPLGAPPAAPGSPAAPGPGPECGSREGDATSSGPFQGTARPATLASSSAPLPLPRTPAGIRPLAPERYRLQVTIGTSTLQKLRLAQDLLRHSLPSGDEATILDRALTLLLEDVARKKFAATSNPRVARATGPESRHIPAEVKRAVWLRDLGRCAFVGTNARRCTEHGFLEFHHVKPWAAGGETSVANVQLRCRRHNGYESRMFFTRELVPERVEAPRRSIAAAGRNLAAPGQKGPAASPPGSLPDRARPPDVEPGGARPRP